MPAANARAIPAHLARMEINTGDDITPVWTPIKGVNEIVYIPSEGTERADTTPYEAEDGRKTHLVTARGARFTLAGFKYYDPEDGEEDLGQAAVEAAAAQVGIAAERQFRFMPVIATKHKTFTATVDLGDQGGNTTAARGWAATLEVTGTVQDTTT